MIPKNLVNRIHYIYNECQRVYRCGNFWTNGHFKGFGSIISESGISSIEMHEAVSLLLILSYTIMVIIKGNITLDL